MARKSETDFDPTRDPFSGPAPDYGYLEHPEVAPSKLMVNNATLVIEPIEDEKPYPGRPLRLPQALMNVDQPHVHTCGPAKREGHTTLNKGCWAAEGGGCPILQQYGRIGPVNLIVERRGKIDSCRCYHFYTGKGPTGRPTSQVHMQRDKWRIITDRTTIPENVRDVDPVTGKAGREYVRQTEVPELAPFYPQKETPKRGRPKGSKNRAKKGRDREGLPAAGAAHSTQP